MDPGFRRIVISRFMVVVVWSCKSPLTWLLPPSLHSLSVMRRPVVILLLVALVALSACGEDQGSKLAPDAAPGNVPDLADTYVVNGFDPLGTEYGGHLTITEGTGLNRYRLQWIITGSIQEGTGSLDGNQLTVEWTTVQGVNREARGTAQYTVTEAGELYGTRTVEGSDEIGTEEAFPNQ